MDKQALRRKLLRGSLAAPVVLTVSSASAAATASFARCLRAGGGDLPDRFFTADSDHWFRQQVPVSMLWANGREQGYFFMDQVKHVYISVDPPYTEMNFGTFLPPGWKVTSQSSRWALVWFDKSSSTQYSRITLQRPHGSSATTMSCYGSFRKA
jgi:hypothetical protein